VLYVLIAGIQLGELDEALATMSKATNEEPCASARRVLFGHQASFPSAGRWP
jgi:hypothetical protein